MSATLRPAKAHTGPNLTPMVDIVMCILIFFMLAMTFLDEKYLTNIQPAISGTSRTPTAMPLPPVRVMIELKRHDNVTWVSAFGSHFELTRTRDKANRKKNNHELTLAFTERHRSMQGDVHYIITPAGRVPYQDVITVYDACSKAGMTQVAFAPAK